jgi:hypothetical protein
MDWNTLYENKIYSLYGRVIPYCTRPAKVGLRLGINFLPGPPARAYRLKIFTCDLYRCDKRNMPRLEYKWNKNTFFLEENIKTGNSILKKA